MSSKNNNNDTKKRSVSNIKNDRPMTCPGCGRVITHFSVHPTFGITNYHPNCLKRSQ